MKKVDSEQRLDTNGNRRLQLERIQTDNNREEPIKHIQKRHSPSHDAKVPALHAERIRPVCYYQLLSVQAGIA